MTKHATPWVAMGELPAFVDDVWELYAPDDWTQANDLSDQMPEKLRELQELFLVEARKYSVLPLDDRRVERFNAAIAGRPELVSGRTQILFGGMGRLTEATVLSTKNVSHAIAADVEIPDGGASGVVVSQGRSLRWLEPVRAGRRGAGLLLQPPWHAVDQGRRCRAAPSGARRITMVFDYDGGGPGMGGDVSLLVDGVEVGAGRQSARALGLLARRDV